MANIRVTPEILKSQGTDLIKFAGDLSDILNSIDSKITYIIDGWDGLAQDAYFDMYTTMISSISLKFFPVCESLTAILEALNLTLRK